MQKQKLYQLIQAIRLVALECPEQISSLPSFVVVPDEIAITLNDTLLTFEASDEVASLSSQLLEKMKELDKYFEDLDRVEFTLDALCRSPRWQHARALARHILVILGAESGKPDLGWIRFVPGGS